MPTQAAWPERLLSEKSGRCQRPQQIKGVALLPMIDRGSVRNKVLTVAAISGLHRALVMVSSSIKADQPDCWNSKKRAERSKRLIAMSEVTAIISALVISHHRPHHHGRENHYRDNAITYKPESATKCQRTEAGERGNYWHADASAWCCCARCKIHEELADAEAENDALRDDVAAGRRRLHIGRSVSQCVKPPPPAWIIPSLPTGRHPLNLGIISPSEGWSLCKNNWKI